MNHQTVRLVSDFWFRQLRFRFGSSPKVETGDAFPVLGHFRFWACTNLRIPVYLVLIGSLWPARLAFYFRIWLLFSFNLDLKVGENSAMNVFRVV